jgi:mannosyl-oligosaccharide alpha-1,2-mannosidase
MSDSGYEYLLKGHMLLGGMTGIYSDMWNAAAGAIRAAMLFRAFIPHTDEQDILFSGIASRSPDSEDVSLEPRTQHLACFAGGMFAMASKIFNEPDNFEIGRQLTQGCIWAYQQSPTGIMPETFTLIPCPDLDGSTCEWNQTEWDLKVARIPCEGSLCVQLNLPAGYLTVPDPRYILRPEAIESVFIMWRMTGDEYWWDVGWEMLQSIIRQTRTPFGHSALHSVMEMLPTEVVEQGVLVTRLRAAQSDDMESFWFAETLKYFYLLFSEPELLSLDEYVLNTEAHPLRLTAGIRGF